MPTTPVSLRRRWTPRSKHWRRWVRRADEARLVFVTHSIPTAMAETAGPAPRSRSGAYVDWHAVVAAEVADRVSAAREVGATTATWSTARAPVPPASHGWSRTSTIICASSPGVGVPAVVAVPIGFVSDHMEVVFDLDTEAAATAKECGLAFARAATAGDHPAFVSGLVDLMLERAAAARGEQPDRPVVGSGTVGWYECRADCCPNLREPGRPALCEVRQLKRFWGPSFRSICLEAEPAAHEWRRDPLVKREFWTR